MPLFWPLAVLCIVFSGVKVQHVSAIIRGICLLVLEVLQLSAHNYVCIIISACCTHSWYTKMAFGQEKASFICIEISGSPD